MDKLIKEAIETGGVVPHVQTTMTETGDSIASSMSSFYDKLGFSRIADQTLYDNWWIPGHPDRRNITKLERRFIPLTQ